MGAVQKLATVVIVGLVALSTLLVVYLADENNRMAAEVQEKDEVAVERGIQTYISNCLVCHGPAGEGYTEPGAQGTGRIGAPLGGDTELGRAAQERNQPEDPTAREERYKQIVDVINNGRGLMPAWGTGLEGGALRTSGTAAHPPPLQTAAYLRPSASAWAASSGWRPIPRASIAP